MLGDSSDENTSIETGYNTYTRTEGVGNQTPPRFEGNNVPVGTFPEEMLNHKKPTLRNNTSHKSLIDKTGKRLGVLDITIR